MTKAELKLKQRGFRREVNYYEKNNLDIIQDIRYIKKTKNEIFEIIFNLLGENKKEIDFRIYNSEGIMIPTVSKDLGQVVLERKEELGWTK